MKEKLLNGTDLMVNWKLKLDKYSYIVHVFPEPYICNQMTTDNNETYIWGNVSLKHPLLNLKCYNL